MRTIPTIIIIVVLLLGGSWTSYYYLQRTTQSLETRFEAIEQSISTQNWSSTEKELNLTQKQWDKTQTMWTIILDHQQIDSIDLSLNRLAKFVQVHDLPLSLGEISTLKLLVEEVADTEKFTLSNIL